MAFELAATTVRPLPFCFARSIARRAPDWVTSHPVMPTIRAVVTKHTAGAPAVSAASNATPPAADTTITTRVKPSMLNDPTVGGLRIDVDTFKGVVTLSGRVKSQAEKDQAIALARKIDGVVDVKDALQVIPEGQ